MANNQILYILENETLGTWWVGKMLSPGRSVSQDELNDKLYKKYPELNPYLTLVSNDGEHPGIERWLSKLEYKIRQNPEKFKDLKQLLTSGWEYHDNIETSTVTIVSGGENMFKQLVKHREGFTRCLNNIAYKTRAERYQERKSDPEFLKRISRDNIQKTGKLPKPSTCEKYQIKDDEIKYTMEEPLGIIYKISSPSGKTYVGQTKRSFKKRIQEHKGESSGCTLIKKAINKYGDEMKYEIIEENVPHEQLDEREIYWIKELNSLAPSGYNLNTGGRFFNITQETKDHLSDMQRKLAIERNGHLGTVQHIGDIFKPVVSNNTKYIPLSSGGFKTRQEAVEVLKQYTQEPDNFVKVEGTVKRVSGSVYKNKNSYIASYKKYTLGYYHTQEEAREALEIYLKDPKKFVKMDKKVGSVYKRNNRWGVNYKGKYVGSYDTQDKAQEALERYLKDPENFIKPQKKIGCVYKKYNKWVVICKGNRLGSYETEEKGQEVLKEYIQSSL